MTHIFDKFFAKIGLEEDEIQGSPLRGILYVGIAVMTALMFIFTALTIFT
ncbi:hypothetical protein DES40_1696 [Litorimonas taeanensis]|uniref:Uncharacterized protein n=1 Tax=Litorimonas taeanensis TaxID=568099 RepID=A0A420WD31_9PROT|nr:hypothetical protein [Litorimonas taeanensis]RKQ68921.1 hypothetical protein DES40_1696 [Litorimonas taeanensis]